MFRTRTARRDDAAREGRIAARLEALGRVLEARGYAPEGLAILEADGGFVVNGLKLPAQGQSYGLVEDGETVSADEIAAALAG
ncbi:MAG TPA: hypothetical protein VFW96_08545 [Thermomicrobiales bacterium]|nr:hypothetical protein [Thermomicrobiales bacterium]